jgi:hypothetical protein
MRSLLALAAVLSALAPTDGRVLDLAGRPADPLSRAGAATVLVFTRTDCPISNRYAPELRRLHDRFAPRGAAFWLVYADPSETVEAIEAHRRAFGLGFDALRDPDHALVRLTGATVTPEVAVFAARAGAAAADGNASGEAAPRMVYRGRIDDRAVDFGRTRVEPTRHDLAEVLETILSGGTVAPRTTTAVGCFIAARP